MKNKIKLIQNLLNNKKESNKNKENLIMEKEKEIRLIKEKLEEEQKIYLDINKEISILKNVIKSNEDEMEKHRNYI